MDNTLPKYMNSPETIVYVKGRHLFGLNIAKNYDTKKLLVVEGYMDAISLFQRGITNVVASLGTALTDAQGRMLRKYANQIILSYDSDNAGQQAIVRGSEILSNMGVDVRVLQMEGAKDPDEYVKKYGSGKFQILMDEAISLVEYKVKVLKQNSVLASTSDKVKFLNEIAKILTAVDNKIEQEIYIDKISRDYSISKEAIYGQINKLKYANNKQMQVQKVIVKKQEVQEHRQTEESIKKENLVLALLINFGKEVYDQIKLEISPEDFKLEQNKKIAKKMYEEFENGKSNIENLETMFSEEDVINQVAGIMAEELEIENKQKCINDCLNSYRKDRLTSRRNEIVKMLENIEMESSKAKELEKELSSIIVNLAKR